jgi:fructose-1,6-bisphosphatase II / sedoheptulose-1,7-bisphosphatase
MVKPGRMGENATPVARFGVLIARRFVNDWVLWALDARNDVLRSWLMSTHISVPQQLMLERILTLELVRVTERAAVSAARLRGHGQEKAADQAAVDAMRRELNKLPIEGTVVIGEGERDEAPMLYIGETVGMKTGPKVDIAVDPLEGTTLCAKNMPGSIATMAMADGGTLLHAPDVYMQKIAVGPGYAKGVVDIDATPGDNVRRLAKAKGVDATAITVLVLDRPRHADIIQAVRATGAAVQLITDGDVAGVIHCADPENTGVDMYLGTGGAPEGVLAAVALRCIGGQMQCRLILDTEEKRERAAKMGVGDPKMIYGIEDMARGDCLFAATGVTTGSLLSGVRFRKDGVIETETVVMRSVTGTVRYIRAEHRQLEKFHLD